MVSNRVFIHDDVEPERREVTLNAMSIYFLYAKNLAGKISFMATPAEEYIELEYRQTLVDNGEIEFFGGKQEFIKLGHFNDVDIAMLTHTGSELRGTLGIGGSNNGMVGKTIRYTGKAAHAGGSPHLGINSLNVDLVYGK